MIRKSSTAAILISLFLMVSIALITSCNSQIPQPEVKTANETIYETFQDWYLWYDQLPTINPNGVATQEALIDSIRNPLDRWSFSASLTEINKLFNSGQYTGFGGGFILDADKKIKIAFVYKDSPFGKSGVERGWEVVSVNGFTSDEPDSINSALSLDKSVTFEFNDLSKISHTLILTKDVISMNTVLYSTVIHSDGLKIGYFVFDSFLSTSAAELDSVFSRFNKENINELIVDLRYNGGGLNDIANQLIAEIGGSKVKNQVISNLKNNSKHSDKDASQTSSFKGVSLNLDRVFFITTSQTASASELVINCLTPFMTVNLTGSKTNGKPVGMYVFSFEKLDLAILPICFKITNKVGYGDYYSGLPVNTMEADDLSHSWGDPEEAMLKSALNSISGSLVTTDQSRLKSMRVSLQQPLKYKGINQLIGAY
jgi:C-terminal processing protease CtpA/Prc